MLEIYYEILELCTTYYVTNIRIIHVKTYEEILSEKASLLPFYIASVSFSLFEVLKLI